MIDLHTHTTFSDGELIPAELVRRATKAGYQGLAITDHADPSNLHLILDNLLPFAKQAGPFLDLNLIVGVELTHVPPPLIPDMVEQARAAGAMLVVVHGETIVEPVARGTNLAAIEAGVDVLAHPGLITEQEVLLAAEKGVHLEITTRKGHSLTNGHVAAMARRFGRRPALRAGPRRRAPCGACRAGGRGRDDQFLHLQCRPPQGRFGRCDGDHRGQCRGP